MKYKVIATNIDDDPYFQEQVKYYDQFIPGALVTVKRKSVLGQSTYHGMIVARERKNDYVDRCIIATIEELPTNSNLLVVGIRSASLATARIEKKIKSVLTRARVKEILKKDKETFNMFTRIFKNPLKFKG